MSRGDRRRRITGEFFLIVLGVVAALGVDRWVQGIDESRTERDYLERLASDVRANVGVFDYMLRDWEAALAASSDLLAAIENPSSRPSHSGLLAAVARAGATNTRLAQDASFQDLAATGNLKVIKDSSLRLALVNYFGQQILAGRPRLDRLDLRFRTFSREYLPLEWAESWRELCPAEVPTFECTTDNPPSTDLIWNALTQDSTMPRILTSRRNEAARSVIIIRTWLSQSEEMLSTLEEALS